MAPQAESLGYLFCAALSEYAVDTNFTYSE